MDSKECETLVRSKLAEYFPMCIEYFDKDPMYASDKVEWFQIIFPDIAYVPCALVCFKEREDNLHLSVIEVSKPCRGNGRGAEIMKHLLKVAERNGYRAMTLQLREPKLESFYQQFGFMKHTDPEGLIYYKCELGMY